MLRDSRSHRRACRTSALAVAVIVLGARASVARGEGDTQGVLDDRLPAPAPPHTPSYLHVALEELAFLGVQTAWYWGHDWSGDEKFNWSNWRTRMTSYHDLVLDDDRFRTGAVGHPIAGTGYYLIARGNGLGVWRSLVATVLASTTWQYFSEWNEKPASNDLLVTPLAGWVLGETSYQLGQYFSTAGRAWSTAWARSSSRRWPASTTRAPAG